MHLCYTHHYFFLAILPWAFHPALDSFLRPACLNAKAPQYAAVSITNTCSFCHQKKKMNQFVMFVHVSLRRFSLSGPLSINPLARLLWLIQSTVCRINSAYDKYRASKTGRWTGPPGGTTRWSTRLCSSLCHYSLYHDREHLTEDWSAFDLCPFEQPGLLPELWPHSWSASIWVWYFGLNLTINVHVCGNACYIMNH